MKEKRHQKILEIIQTYYVENQIDLVHYLRQEGFDATQATVSRDIRELGLVKVGTEMGGMRYQCRTREDFPLEEKFLLILREGILSIETAENLLVIRTVSGMAMAVAAAIDAMRFQEIAGSIAGDDTVMAAVRTTEETKIALGKLKKLL
jgi:transcriptional regulator of arginine metabolism